MADLMGWYYNSKTGIINHQPRIAMETILHAGLGWHGPFDTEAAAVKYYNDNKATNPGWESPSNSVGERIQNLAESANPLNAFSNANLQAWLIRIGEILLGIVLIGVGLAKLTGTTNAIAGIVKARIP
jgi:hypothetical protein